MTEKERKDTRKAELFARYREDAGITWYSPWTGPDAGDCYKDTESGLVLPSWIALQMCISEGYIGMAGWNTDDTILMSDYMVETIDRTAGKGTLSRAPGNLGIPVTEDYIDQLAKTGWEDVGGTLEEPSIWYRMEDMPGILALTGLTAMLVLERPGFPCWEGRLATNIPYYRIPVKTPGLSWRTGMDPGEKGRCLALQIQKINFRRTLSTLLHFASSLKHGGQPEQYDRNLADRAKLSCCGKLSPMQMKRILSHMEQDALSEDIRDAWRACRNATDSWKPLCNAVCTAVEPLANALSW